MESTPADSNNQPGPSPRLSRKGIAGIVAAGVLGGAAIGLVGTMPQLTNAAAPSTTPAPDTTSAPDPAEPPTVASDDEDRMADHAAKIRESLQALVDDGTITAAQADAVAAHLAESRPAPGPPDGGKHGAGPGKGAPWMGPDADAFAAVLGLSDANALRTELQSGKTIAQIAEANGVEIETVKSYLRDQIKARLEAAVADGKLTQEEADEKLADLDAKVDEMINSSRPPRPAGRNGADDNDGAAGPNIVDGDA